MVAQKKDTKELECRPTINWLGGGGDACPVARSAKPFCPEDLFASLPAKLQLALESVSRGHQEAQHS
jgi:hypothetical protein